MCVCKLEALQISYKTTRQHEKLIIRKNSKFVKIESFYKLGPNFYTTPRFLEAETWATLGYNTLLV